MIFRHYSLKVANLMEIGIINDQVFYVERMLSYSLAVSDNLAIILYILHALTSVIYKFHPIFLGTVPIVAWGLLSYWKVSSSISFRDSSFLLIKDRGISSAILAWMFVVVVSLYLTS